MRYRQLLKQAVEKGIPLREISRGMKVGVGSLHDYLYMDTEPRLEVLRRMSVYFNTPVSVLIGEDDDLTGELITCVRQLPDDEKRTLLDTLSKQLVHSGSITGNPKKSTEEP